MVELSVELRGVAMAGAKLGFTIQGFGCRFQSFWRWNYVKEKWAVSILP